MAMTDRERAAKDYLMRKLRRQGYGTYSKLLNVFHLNLTKDPNVAGYMVPKEGRIVINSGLDEDQATLVIRHEILHFYLEHASRIFKKIAAEHNIDINKPIDDMTAEELDREIYEDPDALFNIAGDYEISNRGYTEADKQVIRSMHALVTEDEHSDWVDLTMEEMYDKLREERKNKQKFVYGGLLDASTFVGADGVVYGA